MKKKFDLWVQSYPGLKKLLMELKIAILIIITSISSVSAIPGYSSNNDLQQLVVTGKVTDSQTGEALPGVNVTVKGTTLGVITDIDGKYSLAVSGRNAVLVFSFIGYSTLEIPSAGKSVIDASLVSEIQNLDEVVVTGYSSRKKSELSSSVTVISEGELDQSVSSTNLSTKLQGMVPGMIISGTSGAPGSGASIVVQGQGSLEASSSPLTVVDGIIGGSYDTKDIASITVLRDAAATGLYGSRAANGVIVITTKTGQSGQKKVSVNSTFGPTFNWDDRVKLYDAEGLYGKWSEAMQNLYDLRVSEGNPNFLNTTFDEYRNAAIPRNILDNTTDWYGLLSRTGFLNQHNISMSGGNDQTTIYLSGTFNYEKGTYLDMYDENVNFRANISHKVSNKVTANLRMTAHLGQTAESIDGPQWQAWDNVPVDDGFFYGVPTIPMDYNKVPVWYHWTRNNYFLERNESENWRRTFGSTLMGEVSWQIFDWARFNTSNRASFSGYDDPEYYSAITRQGYTPKGYVNWQQGNNMGYITSNTLHLSHVFGDHAVSGILGHEYNYSRNRWVRGQGYGMVGSMTALSSAGSPNAVGGDMSEAGFLSYFAQMDYSYLNKYFLVGSFRRDASSIFGINKRWGAFYSIGGNWIINRESFLADVPWLNILKIKGSYGTTGNADIANYLWMGTYEFSNVTSYDLLPGAWPARLANPNLTWEVAHKTNIGVDVSIMNRFTLSVDVYHKINDNLLQSVPLQATTGFTSQVRNIGSIQNEGIDFNLTSVNINRGDFRWQSNFNITFNRNKVVSLNNDKDLISGNQIIRVGLPVQYWYLREWLGIDPQTGKNIFTRWEDEEGNRVDGNTTDNPYKITTTEDYDEASIIPTGTSDPIAVGGFSNHLVYKKFYFDLRTNFAFGQHIMCSSDFSVHDLGSNELQVTKWQSHETFWNKPGDIANNAQVIYGDPYNSRGISTRKLYDASYLRFQRVAIGYTFPEVIGIKNLTLDVSVDNLMVLTSYPFGDSDTSFDSPSTGASRYRPTRKFLLNISFDL